MLSSARLDSGHTSRLQELSTNFGEDPASSLLKGGSVPIPVEEKQCDSKIGLEAAHVVFTALWEMVGKISEGQQGIALFC